MASSIDERNGLVKTYWSDIRKRVTKVEPNFAKIVDELAPDNSFPIYLAYYPYGALIGDTEQPFLPTQDGNSFKLSDPHAPKDVVKHLGYGIDSLPMGMVLEKNLEWFIDLEEEQISIPWVIYQPGTFFPFSKVLSNKSNRVYAPNNVLTTTSGARSAFMLPNIGCATNHSNLQRDFNVRNPPPKSLYEHWSIFKDIVNSDVANCNWRSCLIYFSEKWINKLYSDSAWLKLKMYFHELAWSLTDYRRNHIYYDIAFSIIQKNRNLKPNPYLVDTARHLFSVCLGVAPSYAPACNDDSLPLDVLQAAFAESYNLKKYLPTIMQPTHFNFENDEAPIYYSLQNPTTFVFSPKSRKISSTLFEMRELEHIMRIFVNELSREGTPCSDTIISEIAKNIEFTYFHNEPDRHRIVKSSAEIAKFDDRFKYLHKKIKSCDSKFSSDAKFLRGCVSINKKF